MFLIVNNNSCLIQYYLICNFFLDLDLLGLARGSFCLLHLPKMPELKGRDLSSFVPHPVSVEDIPFKSKAYERKSESAKVKKGKMATPSHLLMFVTKCE